MMGDCDKNLTCSEKNWSVHKGTYASFLILTITIKIRLAAAGSAEDHQSSQWGLNLIFEAY